MRMLLSSADFVQGQTACVRRRRHDRGTTRGETRHVLFRHSRPAPKERAQPEAERDERQDGHVARTLRCDPPPTGVPHMHRTLAFVLAGGEGRRLWPLTKERSKPAVYFGGRYRLIDFALS